MTKIIREARGEPPGPPTTDKLKVLAAVLKQAHYRAAPQYLGEYKIMIIEEGHQWTDQLERALKLCKRSTTRALGPRNKAKEVTVMETGKVFAPAMTTKKPKVVTLARELFEFGVIWMLREIGGQKHPLRLGHSKREKSQEIATGERVAEALR